MRLLFDNFVGKKRRPETGLERDVRAEVRQLVELLRTAKSGGVSEAFAATLKRLADRGPEIERGIVAWIELIEALIQGAEQRYPNGYGELKKGQVRAALYRIFQGAEFDIPALPPVLQPLVLDVAIDWSVDALVASIDEYALWDSSRPEGWSFSGFWRASASNLLIFFSPLFTVLHWLYVRLRYSKPLTPEVAAAVQRVRDEGVIADKSRLFRSAYDLAVFVDRHRTQVAAGVKAFFEVVSMAERLASASGPEKKAYASAVVRATLEELGFPIRSGLLGAIADAVINAGIEAAFALLRKRAPETFGPGRPPTTALPLPVR